MELPFHLRALPPEALDVLRFFGGLDEPLAHASIIMEEVGLSERAFGKVVRRLVTKGYLQMGGDQIYRLTDFGQTALEELSDYDETAPQEESFNDAELMAAERQMVRRLVVALPRCLAVGSSSSVQVGFDRAAVDVPPVELVVRLAVVNGEPLRPQERTYHLAREADYNTFQVTPGRYTRMRLRVQVYQLGPNPDDIAVAGGLYVDVPVAAAADENRAAFGADIIVTV